MYHNIVPKPSNIKYLEGLYALPETGSLASAIEKHIDKNVQGEEAYNLSITPEGIKLIANSEKGLFRGWQTIKQLALTNKGGKIPCIEIEDYPRFKYRSFMIDSARHMQSVSELKMMIDAAVFFKFNTFHWHLCDDQGFRIKSDKFPLLTEIGSVRKSSDFGREHVDEPYGGYYTKGEIKEIVDYCNKRHIEVVPEIDMPGHVTAMIASYPELSCKNEKIPLRTTGGIFPEILCAGKETTYEFIFDLLSEITELFPCRYIHIGGDEAPKKFWKKCPECQAKIKQQNLKNEEELQGYFMNRVSDYLKTLNKETITWNESLKSGILNDDIIAQLWMDKDGDGEVWANKGNNVISSDFFYCYMDYPHAMTPLNKTYSYEPVSKGILPLNEENVMGVEGLIWTEYVDNILKMSFQCYPRFAAIAEVGWTQKCLRDEKDFLRRISALAVHLEGMGINPAPQREWNPNLLKRAADTVSFFAKNLSTQAIKDFIDLKKE